MPRDHVRGHRADEGRQHDGRRGRQAAHLRGRRVRDRDAPAVRALHRPLAVRRHVDLARLLAGVPGASRRGHVLRRGDFRGAPRPRADGTPGGEPACDQGGTHPLHQVSVRRGSAQLSSAQTKTGGPRVLVTESLFGDLDVERSILEPLGAEVVLAAAADEATLVREARRADALMVVYAKVTAPVVESAAQAGCRVIARYGVGYDNVDVEAATRHGIQVTYVPDYCLDEVADHTIALLLAYARGVVEAAQSVREGAWTFPQAVAVHRIAGRRLGLLGLGRIGRRVADRARAFGLQV